MMRDYLLADDLSGALEAGAAFRLNGLPVTVQLKSNSSTPVAGKLLVCSSETRNARPDEAAKIVSRLLAERRAAGDRLVMKKIDSTMRGPVGAEIRALQSILAPPLIVVCPASPAVGRTVREGRLLVHGVPVAETEFRRDPGWPVVESELRAVLASSGLGPVAYLPLSVLRDSRGLADIPPEGVLVSDAETERDLIVMVSQIRRRVPDAVFVGAGGLAHALSAILAPAQPADVAPRNRPGKIMVVSGSLSPRSRRQLEVLRDHGQIPLHEFYVDANESAVARALQENLRVARGVALTLAQHESPIDSSLPVRKLAEIIRLVFQSTPIPELLALTGGETASAVCAVLGISTLELLDECERGVVIARVPHSGAPLPKQLVIKPGGFGSDDVWVRIV